ncbi:MAG TPA: hypothetical protein VFE47_04680 [Tepidisphaeraceae bacterium]|nr:hypothetical protein [Tepidisphaeraceae bacterium]
MVQAGVAIVHCMVCEYSYVMAKKKRERKYFIAKHDLASFLAWPGVIWRTGETEFPRGFKMMQAGDRWVEFAFINDENRRDRTSQVVGFYECVSLPTKRIAIPPKPRSLCGNSKFAWAIKGRAIGWQPSFPVTVPSINTLLGKTVFGRQVLSPVSKDDFDLIRQRVKQLKLDPKRIPMVNRDPRNEQEVVGILLTAHAKLGIERIDRVRAGFPDLRVKIEGKRELVHLEVETYSSNFILHGHHHQVSGGVVDTKDKSEKLPVAVVCWYDDDKNGTVAACVHKVYELRNLLQRNEKIRWGR